MDYLRVKFRASSVGNLLVGGNEITDKQLVKLGELLARHESGTKPLTPIMQQELDDLIAKRDGDFQFGATALSHIRNVWLLNEFGYDEPIVSNEMLKGILCEDEAIGVLSRQFPGGFRLKNEELFENEWFTGTPDVIEADVVNDVKCSWSLRTFMEAQKPDPIYYAQGQVYMDLTGTKRFRLVHILLETPFELMEDERKRFYFRFNCNEESPHYQRAILQLDAMNAAIKLIPEKQRVKCFEFDRDDRYLDKLIGRVEQARKVYASLSLELGVNNE